MAFVSDCLRGSGEGFYREPSENVIAPTLGTSFDSLGEAEDFYNLYSWEEVFQNKIWAERAEC